MQWMVVVAPALLVVGAVSANLAGTVPPRTDGSALSHQCTTRNGFDLGGGHVDLIFDPQEFSVSPSQVCDWVTESAQAVTSYFGRFPVHRVRLVLKPVDGDHISGGTTYGGSDDGNPLIVVRLGRSADMAALQRDWVMTHEMVHLSVPSVPDNSHWLEEGIATYVEPIARAQVGAVSVHKVWADMFHGMVKGMPVPGDQGLDYTPTWGRTYWGGALFCLMADVEIRRRTGNRMGLQDALRGVLAAGGSIRQDWSVERVLTAGDRATGVPVLMELYKQMGATPSPAAGELEALWRQLGVLPAGDDVALSEDSPLAPQREAITAPPS